MRVLVAGWIGSTNLGDELLFARAKRELEARGVAVIALSVRPAATTRDHGCDAVSATRPDAIGRAIGAADAVVLVGGTMQDITSPLNLPFHTLPLRMAQARGTPVVGFGVGVDRLRTALGRRLARRALGGLRGLTVRDDASADAVQGLGLDRPTVSADLVMATPASARQATDRIGVSLRTWSGGGALPAALHWRRGLRNDWFVDSIAAALDATGRAVHFIAFQPGRDDELHQRVAARMATSPTHASPTVHSVVDEIGSCSVVVAMRYHAAVCAAATERPFVAFDLFAKLQSVAKDLGAPSVAWSADGVSTLPSRLATARCDAAAIAALRMREGRNGAMLDRLLGSL